jgi:hypothetical protein
MIYYHINSPEIGKKEIIDCRQRKGNWLLRKEKKIRFSIQTNLIVGSLEVENSNRYGTDYYSE